MAVYITWPGEQSDTGDARIPALRIVSCGRKGNKVTKYLNFFFSLGWLSFPFTFFASSYSLTIPVRGHILSRKKKT